jgi:hypothetical protein
MGVDLESVGLNRSARNRAVLAAGVPPRMAKMPEFKLRQRGTFPAPGWTPSRWPRASFYACSLSYGAKLMTPWFARAALTWGRSEFWLYLWPWPRVEKMRRFGRRRLLGA